MTLLKSIMLAAALLLAPAAWSAELVDINSADAATLEQNIKGVGPSKADAIIKYREQVGGFASVEDLLKVPGIGAKTLEDNRDRLTVGDKSQ